MKTNKTKNTNAENRTETDTQPKQADKDSDGKEANNREKHVVAKNRTTKQGMHNKPYAHLCLAI